MYCPECGTEAIEGSTFCGNCGFNLSKGPAKSMDTNYSKSTNITNQTQNQNQPPQYVNQAQNQYQPPQYTNQPQNQYQQPQYANQQQYGVSNVPPASMYYDLNPRSWGLWIILSFCTCGIAELVYLYFNFEDTRKLEGLIQANRNVQFYKTTTTDPILAVILFFVCTPAATILKYSTLYNLIQEYYMGQPTPRCANASKIIGVWVGMFFSIFIGIFILPLLVVPFILLVYSIYLDYQWQEVMNTYIMNNKDTAMMGSPNVQK